MRALFINEALTHFTEDDSDPVQDMGIGYIILSSDEKELRAMPSKILSDAIDRLKLTRSYDATPPPSRVMIDGKDYEEYEVYMRYKFLNKLYAAHRYKVRIESRDQVRALNFKHGDAIKAEIKGKTYYGYIKFSKRGLPQTDTYARVLAVSPDGLMKIPYGHFEPVSPKEKKEFDKDYGYILFKIKQQEIWKDMLKRQHKQDAKYHELKREYYKLSEEISDFIAKKRARNAKKK